MLVLSSCGFGSPAEHQVWETPDNKASYLEPITRDFPEYGRGGASQAMTNLEVQAKRIIDLRSGKVLFEKR